MTGSPEVPSEDFCMKRLLSTASITWLAVFNTGQRRAR